MASDGQLRLTVVRRGQGRPRLNDEERKENAEWDKATRRGNSASKKVQEEAVIDTLVTEALAASRHLTCNRTDSSSNLERSESVDNWLHCQRIQQSRRTNSVPSSGKYAAHHARQVCCPDPNDRTGQQRNPATKIIQMQSLS